MLLLSGSELTSFTDYNVFIPTSEVGQATTTFFTAGWPFIFPWFNNVHMIVMLIRVLPGVQNGMNEEEGRR